MKLRLLLALVGFALGFAVPAFAQQKEGTVDSQITTRLLIKTTSETNDTLH
jgi:hypothetical protein